jgi:hypothetical protein
MTDEIERVRREEERRGRRPIDSDTREERRRMMAALSEIYNYGTLDELMAVMREYGISAGSPQWIETLRIWNAERARNPRSAR